MQCPMRRCLHMQYAHTSKINDLRSSLNSKEMLQNFLYLYKKETQVVFFVFHFEHFWFFSYECPGLWRQRPGHWSGKPLKLLKMKNGKKTMWVLLLKNSKFWSISLEFKVESKSFILELWYIWIILRMHSNSRELSHPNDNAWKSFEW